jgi:hypothetical protein
MKCIPETSTFAECMADPQFQLGLMILIVIVGMLAIAGLLIWENISDYLRDDA